MTFRVLVAGLLISGIGYAGDQQLTSPLPKKWHGSWRGKLVITNKSGKPQEVPILLKIEPIKDTREATWAITYEPEKKAVLRNYKLVPAGDKPGQFQIDEQNGILLDARLVNNILYSQFKVGEAILTARYELRGERLVFEVTSAQPAPRKTGKGKVHSYPVEVIQAAELTKQPTKQ